MSKLTFAKITGAHGVRGELKIFPYADSADLDSLFNGDKALDTVYIDGVSYALRGIRRLGGGRGAALVKLDGIDDRDSARGLVGKFILIDRDNLPALTEGEYYQADLIGMDVLGQDGKYLGKLTGIFSAGASQVYEVKGQAEILVPAISDFIVKIDMEKKTIIIRTTEGLW